MIPSDEQQRCVPQCLLADIAAILITVLFFLLCLRFTQLVVDGWDPLAYLYAAERMALGESFAFCHPYNREIGPYFTMAGFNVGGVKDECLYLNYPPGFPLLLAFAEWLLPTRYAMFVLPSLFGALGALAIYLLGRLLLDAKIGLTAMVLLILTSTYLQFSTSLWSDLPVTTLLLSGLVALVWCDLQSSPKVQLFGALGAGILIGWAVFARYSVVVFLLPVAVYLVIGRNVASLLRSRVVWGLILSLGLVFVGIAVFNATFYGGPLTTPYGVEHGWYNWPKFSFQYALGRSPVGDKSLLAMGEGIWNAYGILTLVSAVGLRKLSPRLRGLVLAGVGVFVVFYGLYAFPARGINVRFVLPILPLVALLISAGLWQKFDAPLWVTWAWRSIAVVVMIFVLLVPLPTIFAELGDRNAATEAYVVDVIAMVDSVEADAVILAYHANDAVAFYTERTPFFYRRIQRPIDSVDTEEPYFEPELVSAVLDLLEQGVPVYYYWELEPSPWNSFSVLERHFILSATQEAPMLYKIVEGAPMPALHPLGECKISHSTGLDTGRP
jgi:4-amino-4-deoxy-L-arabinose transferase-like glycosyltransferase